MTRLMLASTVEKKMTCVFDTESLTAQNNLIRADIVYAMNREGKK